MNPNPRPGSGNWKHVELRILKLPDDCSIGKGRIWREPFARHNWNKTERERMADA